MKRLPILLFALFLGAPAWAAPGVMIKDEEMRASASASAAMVGRAARGASVDILARQRGWTRISNGGRTGWVRILSVRSTTSGAALGNVIGMVEAGTSQRDPGRVVAVAGLRGLNEEELRLARFNASELMQLDRYTSDRADAQSFARGAGLMPIRVPYLPNPQLEPRILLIALAEELGLSLEKLDYQFHLVRHINQHLLDLAAQGRKVVVVIDEAQCMPLETLESLRLLSNLETEKRKLIQIVLFGQPELDKKLANPAVRQLRQRIVFSYRMPGLQQYEVGHYLAHRLRVAGHRDGDIFSSSAKRLIHRLSGGTPRLVNILAHKAMLLAYGEGRAGIARGHVLSAGRDSEGVRQMAWWQQW